MLKCSTLGCDYEATKFLEGTDKALCHGCCTGLYPEANTSDVQDNITKIQIRGNDYGLRAYVTYDNEWYRVLIEDSHPLEFDGPTAIYAYTQACRYLDGFVQGLINSEKYTIYTRIPEIPCL